jgi:predicted transcriptional regulator
MPPESSALGRRERQIVEAVYRLGRATVTQVQAELPDPPSYSAVRAMLNLLEDKGHLRHEQDGLRYVYLPVVAPKAASRSALAHVVRTFFGGNPVEAANALLDLSDHKLSEHEQKQLSRLIRKAMDQGR